MNLNVTTRRRRWWSEHSTGELPEHTGPDVTNCVDDADAIRRALAALSPPHRAAVVLRYYAQLSEAETAKALGIAPGTVKSRLSHALAQLSIDPNLNDLAGMSRSSQKSGTRRPFRRLPRPDSESLHT